MPRILIVEDDENLRALLKSALSSEGHEVTEAADGGAALKHLAQTPADLVVTDMLMPGKEGVETIVEIRRNLPQTKIIAISGGLRGSKFDILRMAEKVGAHRSMAKPFSMGEIIQAVADLLAR